jgi:hypothetical protein
MMSDTKSRRRSRVVREHVVGDETEETTQRDQPSVEIGLNAAIVAVVKDSPVVLVIPDEESGADGLPFGPFAPLEHRTLEMGLRAWVREQASLDLGYAEQLYTFADRGRHASPDDKTPHTVSIGYLALTHAADPDEAQPGVWRSWYHYFPWEDWRKGTPKILTEEIEPCLRQWAEQTEHGSKTTRPLQRIERIRMCFGLDGASWDEEKVLDRFELLYEAGLVEEARRDGRKAAGEWAAAVRLGLPMRHDHRRILATAIGRVRGKIKYRPVIFELMPAEFTLFELQKTVEAILGPHLHKQNFRRLVESAGLVEPTGDVRTRTGGRPAKLYRFRRDVLLERPSPGVRVKHGRGA